MIKLFLLAQILATTSATMQPQTWQQIHSTTNSGNTSVANYTRTLFQDACNNSSGIGSFKDKMQWDAATKNVWFSGADAGGNIACGKVLKYEETSGPQGTWSNPVPSIRAVLSPLGITTITHNYEQSAFDPATKRLYWRSFNSKRFWYYDTVANTWTEIATYPWANAQTSAMEWIPSMGLVVADNGRVAKWDQVTNTWTTIAANLAFGYSNFLDYNPVLGICLFGGGGQTPNKLFKMTVPQGVVTALADSPVALGTQSPSGAVVTHDPVSGFFLILPQAGLLQQYDVTNQSWFSLGAVPFYTTNGAGNVQAVPLPEYGTVFFAVNKQTIWGNNLNGTWLYKHTASTPPPDPVPGPPTGLGFAYTLAWTAPTTGGAVVGYKIYDNGQEIGATSDTSFKVTLGTGVHTLFIRAFNQYGSSRDWQAGDTNKVTINLQ